jgi:hypothetical protein
VTSGAKGAKEGGIGKSRFSEEQIVGIPNEHAAGGVAGSLCQHHVISVQTLCARSIDRCCGRSSAPASSVAQCCGARLASLDLAKGVF